MTDFDAFSGFQAERLLDYLSTTILVFDEQFELRYINPAGEVMFATSARHARGKSIDKLIHNACQVTDHLRDALQSEHVLTQRGCRLELPDGQELVVNCTHTPVEMPGRFTGVMLELRKVDHQLRIEQEEHLINQQEATQALVRGLAHEIKNPLGGLRGAAQLLEREICDEALREYTGIIIAEADRLQNLMDSMLGPNNVPNMQPVNIHVILERVRELVQVESGTELKLVKDYDPSLPELQADPDLLYQAMLNIVRNAAQALEGHGSIRLVTRVKRKHHIGTHQHRLVASIEIIDDGPGIDAALLGKIFYPMITTRSEGSGLGLSISQSLISRHRGLIECSSRPGKTVFTILLPLDNSI